jgi:hypothetical protein
MQDYFLKLSALTFKGIYCKSVQKYVHLKSGLQFRLCRLPQAHVATQVGHIK